MVGMATLLYSLGCIDQLIVHFKVDELGGSLKGQYRTKPEKTLESVETIPKGSRGIRCES